jgi:hypothetical protein
LVWKVRLSPDAQADLQGVASWLSQPGAGQSVRKKLKEIWAGIRGLRANALRHPIFTPTGGRKCSISGGYEIHYDVFPYPPGSIKSGIVVVSFIKSPYQDYATFEDR